jgi:hypothetical protein
MFLILNPLTEYEPLIITSKRTIRHSITFFLVTKLKGKKKKKTEKRKV